MGRLYNGQLFPSLEIAAVGGGTIRIPQCLRVDLERDKRLAHPKRTSR